MVQDVLRFPVEEPRAKVVYSREDFAKVPLPARVADYPELRYMGSKHRLLPWIHGVLRNLKFATAADPFVGSGCVAYLLKAMGKRVIASDFLNFPAVLATATVANNKHRLDGPAVKCLLAPRSSGPRFIEQTFEGIFYNREDLRFLDQVSANIDNLEHPHQQALARAALIRSCLKKQPRGVFTVSGDLSRGQGSCGQAVPGFALHTTYRRSSRFREKADCRRGVSAKQPAKMPARIRCPLSPSLYAPDSFSTPGTPWPSLARQPADDVGRKPPLRFSATVAVHV
jgi:hypothetical protein